MQLYGWSAVDLFFVISGFIFAHRYLENWSMRREVTLDDFFIARIARLWPLHLLTLALAVVLFKPDTLYDWGDVALSALFAHVLIDDPTYVLNAPAWSLSVEMICYAVFAFLAMAGGRWLKVGSVIAVLAGCALIAAYGVWAMPALIGRGLAGFFIGVALYRFLPAFGAVPSLLLAALACLPLVFPPDHGWLILTLGIAWPALLLLVLRIDALGSPLFAWLGSRSYAIYLLHVPVYYAVRGPFAEVIAGNMQATIVALVASWAITLIVSNALYKALERPAQKAILSRYYARKKAALGAAPSPREA